MPNRYNLNQKAISRQSLLQALVELISESGTIRISISDLCRRAGTSRMAFYRNFDNLREVLQFYLENRKQSLLETFEDRTERSWQNLGLLFMNFAEQERPILQAMVNDGLSSMLTDFLVSGIELFNTRYYTRTYRSDLEAGYAARFEAGGMISVLSEWYSRDCRDSKEDIIRLIMARSGIPLGTNR